MAPKKKSLVFVDTNIFLDFYRSGGEGSLERLKKLASVPENVIMTEQVEMEFKKNRNTTILSFLNDFRTPEFRKNYPGLFAESELKDKIEKHLSAAKEKVDEIKKKLEDALNNPIEKDEAYKHISGIFSSERTIRLNYKDPEFKEIYERASVRYNLGMPPRKAGDTSFGDAINWEFMLAVCRVRKSDLVIVTRDSDFGKLHRDKIMPNLWLQEEFNKETGGKELEITHLLNSALKHLGLKVSPEEIKKEESEAVESQFEGYAELIKKLTGSDFSYPAKSNRWIDSIKSTGTAVSCPFCSGIFVSHTAQPPGNIYVCHTCSRTFTPDFF